MEEKLFVSTKNRNNDWIGNYWNVVGDYWQKDNEEKRKIYNKGGFVSPYKYPKVKKIIYNFKNPDKPATIVFFDDGSKVVVKCDAEDFTREGGLAQCYLKKILGTRGNIKKLIENADIQE